MHLIPYQNFSNLAGLFYLSEMHFRHFFAVTINEATTIVYAVFPVICLKTGPELCAITAIDIMHTVHVAKGYFMW